MRLVRLMFNLPPESRLVSKYSPMRDWSWEKETQAQILAALDRIQCTIYNTHKPKGRGSAKPPELMQPDYVKRAKKEARFAEVEKKKTKPSKEEMDKIREYWKRRNPNAKVMEDDNE